MGKEIDPEKLLDMIRSILPSRSRCTARRSKAAENRVVRRCVRGELRSGRHRDLHRKANHYYTVQDRRRADKLNHFMRWCEQLTEGLSVREALDFVRAILPHNLIGDHAYLHWKLHVTIETGHFTGGREKRRRRIQSETDSMRCRLRRVLAEAPHVLGELNATIKSLKQFEQPRRLLLGIHDVDDFVSEIVSTDCLGLERKAVRMILESGRPPGRPRHLESAA